MRQPQVWATWRFPREVTPTQGLAAWLATNGSSTPLRADTIVWEVVGTADGITHRMRVSEARSGGLYRQLHTAVPGLSIEPIEGSVPPTLSCTRAWRAWQSSKTRSLNTDQPEVIAHAVLAALSAVEGKESLILQWFLGPVRRPAAVANKTTGSFSGNIFAVLGKAALHAPEDLDSDAIRALRSKDGLPGWKGVLVIGVAAKSLARERQLLGGLASAIRVAQGPGVQMGFDGMNPNVLNERRLPWRWRVAINVAELLGLSGLPLGDVGQLPVSRVSSRQLAPSRALKRTGHVVGSSKTGGSEVPIALSIDDSLKQVNRALELDRSGHGSGSLSVHGRTPGRPSERRTRSCTEGPSR
jgi:hypothetical protein